MTVGFLVKQTFQLPQFYKKKGLNDNYGRMQLHFFQSIIRLKRVHADSKTNPTQFLFLFTFVLYAYTPYNFSVMASKYWWILFVGPRQAKVQTTEAWIWITREDLERIIIKNACFGLHVRKLELPFVMQTLHHRVWSALSHSNQLNLPVVMQSITNVPMKQYSNENFSPQGRHALAAIFNFKASSKSNK